MLISEEINCLTKMRIYNCRKAVVAPFNQEFECMKDNISKTALFVAFICTFIAWGIWLPETNDRNTMSIFEVLFY